MTDQNSGRISAVPAPETLPALKLAAFASIGFPLATAGLPLAVYLPPIYAEHHGLSLTAIGLIFLAGRLWDAVSDPLVGALSDRTRSRFGRRKPWIAAGGAVFALAAGLLFFPSGAVTPLYLTAVLFLFYLGWTMIQIPYLAWSGELSGHYHERTRVATYSQVAHSTALVAALVLPTILDQVRPNDAALKLAGMGGLVIATLLPALLLSLTSFRESLPARHAGHRTPGLRETLTAVAHEPLLLRVLGSDFAVTLAQSIRGALFVFFVSHYMGLPHWASALFLIQFVFGVFAGPIWMKIGQRFGKHQTAVAGELVQVAINLGLLLVTPDALPLLIGLSIAQGLAQGSANLMLRAIVADVADKNRLDTGVDRTGLFFSVFSLAGKAATAAAIGIALPLVAWLGFDPRATNTPQALENLLLIFSLGPALAHLISAALIHGFPLDETRHSEIRRRLAERDTVPGAAAVAAE